MNAVEIEEAVSKLVEHSFDPEQFPYAFLQAFGNKETTLRKLRTGDTNKSDIGGVLQRNNIHIAVAVDGEVSATLTALRKSPATEKHKVKFILVTDGKWLEAENLGEGTPLACDFVRLPDFFGFFLPLAGISTVREIVENAFDIRATSKLNRLYIELLKENPDWGTDERRPDMNHFMARLIFSFFAEDTGIFSDEGLFTKTVSQMSTADSSNTHEIIETLFRTMNTKHDIREAAGIPRWANHLPFVNGGLFSGTVEVPRFTRTARSYLLQVGALDWKQINPDIFGSMIQAVADDEERGALGMHYTSVPNILKVLNPLVLDDLRATMDEASDNPRKLLNLRNRIRRIRIFDPACGSGNFLVIAYKSLREIEHEINRRRGEPGRRTEIPLTNFRGIELRDFAAQIARLALIIAEFQCDVRYRGQQEALSDILPLDAENWIVRGNALRLDWRAICPTTGTGVTLVGDDLFSTPRDQSEIDFENEGGETYICGNPPYAGLSSQSVQQKDDLFCAFDGQAKYWKSFDYVMGWFWKAHHFMRGQSSRSAFVTTNSICQGQLVPMFWPLLLNDGSKIIFAHTSFKWSNLAANNAGVTVAIIGFAHSSRGAARLFSEDSATGVQMREVSNISPYLVPGANTIIRPLAAAGDDRAAMVYGNKAADGGNLILLPSERQEIAAAFPDATRYIFKYAGSQELIRGDIRHCIWVTNANLPHARSIPALADRFAQVAGFRGESKASSTRAFASSSHRFRQIQATAVRYSVVVPRVSSERREYLPVGVLESNTIISDSAFALYDAPLWNLSLIASRLHLVWIAAVCGKLKTDFRYSNTLGWNTFPLPPLSDLNKADLSRCAGEILLARETHFPATIAELYDAAKMPANLREAHQRNDETLERIYVGRTFRNDTERLEKLFEMYQKMTGGAARPIARRSRRKAR